MTFSEEYVSIPEIESFIVDYLDGVFEEISMTYDTKYSRLVPTVVVSTTSQPQSYRISIDGVVYYFNEIPRREALDNSLNEYFSSMGTSNLENEFITFGFEEAVVNSIYIGDDRVIFPGDEATGIQGFFRNDDGGLNKRNIIGGYVILVLVAVTIALVVCRYKVGRRRKRGERQSQSNVYESSTESSKQQNDEESGIDSKINSSGSSEPHSSNVKTAGSSETPVSGLTEKPSGDESDEEKGSDSNAKTSIDNSERSSKTTASRRSLVMKKRISRLSAKSKASTKSERNDRPKPDEEEQTRTIREAGSF